MSRPTSHSMTPVDLWNVQRVGAPVPAREAPFAIVPITTANIDENTNTTRLYRVSKLGEGNPTPLTAADRSATSPAISPDDTRLAFVRKSSDDDKGQIHVMALDGGEARCVTDFPLGAVDPRWMPDGKRLVCVAPVLKDAPTLDGTRQLLETREADPVIAHATEDRVYRFWDSWLTDGQMPHLFIVDIESGDVTDLTPDSERWFEFMDASGQFDISPDGTEIAFSANATLPPYDVLKFGVFTVPVAGGPITLITGDQPAEAFQPRYSPDGRSIVYGANRELDFYADPIRLVRYDRATGTHTWLTDDWDGSASSWKPTNDAIVFVGEYQGRTLIWTVPLAGGEPRPITDSGTASSPTPCADGYTYIAWQTMSMPAEATRVPTAGGPIEMLTRANTEFMQTIDFGEVEERTVTGAHGDPVQVYVIYPPGFDRSKTWPLVHVIHGGPHGISGDQFHFRWNAHQFAAPGYVVAMVNFHGSTSFGDAFARSIHGAWGEMPMADIMAATDALVAEGFIDEERIAVTGGSYGGYMTSWLTSQSDRFACAVCHAGVVNLPGMYATDATQGMGRSQGGTPWGDRDAVERFSPVAHAKGFTTPTLVVHGEKDYRVPVTQGLELYGLLKAKGVDARLLYYPDENHWILKPKNSLRWYGEVLDWLARYLRAGHTRHSNAVATAAATQS